MLKKFTAVLLAIFMVSVSVCPSFAQETAAANYSEWESLIDTAINNLESSITLTIKNFDKNVYSLNKLLYQNIKISAEGIITGNVGEIKYSFEYPQNFRLIRAAENPTLINKLDKGDLQLYNYVKAMSKTLTENALSEYEKVLKIHNYIILASRYDEENFKKRTVPDSSFTVAGLLYDGIGVCEAYAATFQLMATFSGLESQMVTGTSRNVNHAWNIVRIDGEYYHIDTTFDDPTPDTKGQVIYKYFNVTDEQISKDHKWDKTKTPECTAEKYNYFMYNNMVVSSMAELENYLNSKLSSKPRDIQFYTKGFAINKVKELEFVFKTKKIKSYTVGGEFGKEGAYLFIPEY